MTRYATADQYAMTLGGPDLPLNVDQRTMIESLLDRCGATLQASLASAGAGGCTLAGWATEYLAQLNIRGAAVYHSDPCGRPPGLSDALRQSYSQWFTDSVNQIRSGEIELCQGETGSDYPYMNWAEQSLTVWNTARIISNAEDRTP